MKQLRSLNLKAQVTSRTLVPPEIAMSAVERPEGYAIEGVFHFRATAMFATREICGYGSGENLIASAKAVSELYERYAMFATAGGPFRSTTSNGWAAHSDLGQAIECATFELIERDSAMQSWFAKGPFLEIPKALWPDEIVTWRSRAQSLEYSEVKLTLYLGAHGVCVSAFLLNATGGGVVGHASSADLNEACMSAFHEALRSAHASLRFDAFDEVQAIHRGESRAYSPSANALAYAYGTSFPQMEMRMISEKEVEDVWVEHLKRIHRMNLMTSFASFKVADRTVVNVFCPGIEALFWGPTPPDKSNKNNQPHFVG